MFWIHVALGSAFVGKPGEALAAGGGCDQSGQSVDGPGGERGAQWRTIPVAWKVLRAEEEGSWRPYWEQLFAHLHGAIPADWFVLVLADRGLYARWMWDAIVAQGWHPFLRINLGVKASLANQDDFDWISRWVPAPGTHFTGVVDCFAGKKSRLRATLLLHWEPGYETAWAIVTDLDPQLARDSVGMGCAPGLKAASKTSSAVCGAGSTAK